MSDTTGSLAIAASTAGRLAIRTGDMVEIAGARPTVIMRSGGVMALVAPPPTLSLVDEYSELNITAPTPTLEISSTYTLGDMSLVAPTPIVLIKTESTWANVALEAPVPVLSVLSNYTLANVALEAPVPSLDIESSYTLGILTVAAPCPTVEIASTYTLSWLALTGPTPTISLSGLEGTIGSLVIVGPTPTVLLSGWDNTTGNLAIVGPTPTISMSQLWSALKTLVMNVDNAALTEYTNFDFLSFAKLGNKVLGLRKDGNVYLLGGEKDVAANISASFETGQDDLGSSNSKRLIGIILGLRSSGDLNVQSRHWNEYAGKVLVETAETEVLETRKIATEKLRRSRTLGVRVENVSGADFSVDSMELYVKEVPRRSGGA